mgnify:CR=1 FL=1
MTPKESREAHQKRLESIARLRALSAEQTKLINQLERRIKDDRAAEVKARNHRYILEREEPA